MVKRVVMFSGGAGSYVAAKRVAARHGTNGLVLLFSDTAMEDPDLYRFLPQAADAIGAPLVTLRDGRTPWEVFRDRKFLGNSRVDLCSRILKREICDQWLADNCDPAGTVIYVGIDWSERHRHERLAARKLQQGWIIESPLCDPPFLSKRDLFAIIKQDGLDLPRLYQMGFAHNNCGGFCIKAGHGHFANLLKQLPDVYAYHEQQEQDLAEYLGSNVTVLTDRSDGRIGAQRVPMSLREFRQRVDDGMQIDLFDVGGCGCFSDGDDDE